MNPDGYVYEIESLEKEIKRLNSRVKNLRQQKRKAQERLYYYMKNNSLETYGKYSLEKVKPRPPLKRKTEKQKRQDAINFLQSQGITTPDNFYKKFRETQRSRIDNSQPKPKKQESTSLSKQILANYS